MFFPRSTPPAVAESKLLGLRASLTTPVLAIEELPQGPAEAAIVVLAGADGAPSVTLAVRAVRSGALVFYGFEGPLEAEADLETALDGALSFGESMGFLFDDDALGQGDTGSQRALSVWLAVLADAASPPPSRPDDEQTEPRVARKAAADDEIVFELGVEGAAAAPRELMLDRPVEPSPAPARPERRAPLALTKFRRTLAGSGSEAPGEEKDARPERRARPRPKGAENPEPEADPVLLTPHGPAVGRVQLVKQRREEGPPAPLDPLLRLLASL